MAKYHTYVFSSLNSRNGDVPYKRFLDVVVVCYETIGNSKWQPWLWIDFVKINGINGINGIK